TLEPAAQHRDVPQVRANGMARPLVGLELRPERLDGFREVHGGLLRGTWIALTAERVKVCTSRDLPFPPYNPDMAPRVKWSIVIGALAVISLAVAIFLC